MGRGTSGGGGSRGFSGGGGGFRPSGPRPGPRPGGIHIGGFWNGIFLGSIISRNRSGGSSVSGNSGGAVPKYKKERNKVATLIVGLVILAMAVACIVCANVFTYKTTNATVVSYRQVTEFGQTYYYATYTYQAKGAGYTHESQISWTYDGDNPADTNEYAIGTIQRIKYKNTDVTKIYEADGSDRIDDDFGVMWWIFGVIFIIGSVITFGVGINKHVPIDEQESTAQASASKSTLAEGQIRCKYCGGIMDKDDDYCPSCGARKQ